MVRKDSVPCDARVADGAIRGGIVGLLWAGFFGVEEIAAMGQVSTMRATLAAGGYLGASVVSFGAFFGLYNGVLCQAERFGGGNALVGPCLAGATMGAAIGACMPPPRLLTIGQYSAFLAFVSVATASMMKAR